MNADEWNKATKAILEARPRKKIKKAAKRKEFRKDKYRESSGVVFTGMHRFVGR